MVYALDVKFLFSLRHKIKLCDLALREHTGVGFLLYMALRSSICTIWKSEIISI